MITATVKLRSTTPYSQSRKTVTPKSDNETHDQHEQRTWRERMHTMPDGLVFIPPMSFKGCIETAASDLGLKVPGQGQKTYGKLFEKGVLVLEPLVLPVKAEDVPGEELFVPSDGKRGGGSRVTKVFPRIDQWEGEVTFHVLDGRISEQVFTRALKHAGLLIGLGRFRPERRGYYGRFEVVKVDWKEVKE